MRRVQENFYGGLVLNVFEANYFEIKFCLRERFIGKVVLNLSFTSFISTFVLIFGEGGSSSLLLGFLKLRVDCICIFFTANDERQFSLTVLSLT